MGPSTTWFIARSAVVVGLAVAGSACVDDPDPVTTTGTTQPGQALDIIGGSSQVYCDNTDRVIGRISGAEPGEKILLTSPQPIQLSNDQENAVADDQGTYQLTWRCSPSEAGQPWELRVEGLNSGRRADVSFVGTATDPDLDEALALDLDEAPFVCDGESRIFGRLSNASPREPVTFTAAGADGLVDGTAETDGSLPLTWRCSPSEAGTWEVMARGIESDRTVEFTVVGVAPAELVTPGVRVIEDPFVCDGERRDVAALSGFVPDEVVTFSASQTTDLIDGRADGSGDLTIGWTCGNKDAGTVWELTATGLRSERTVTVVITGAAAARTRDPEVAMTEDPFRCDSTTRFFATITGFARREFVDFESPQVEDLRQGQADDTGALDLRWTCDAADVGRTWEITATGANSGRAITFQITGGAPEG
ncbi:MAG: hypothetical protein ACR2QO_08195 [Acidimicrobiales bacterium]